ncbi:ABC transporter permease [Robbsia andropogonis]|uniref:ABC transporter permease n=1 Tax=Robbsia andropogonis TaxID=28092 RepID=A0A0F5K0N9_9BURK|nr:ABC transporter permease [Robbsia andropogonis]KKB63648.1 ABC transporter permease [Robbsia andropogonis]
MSADDILRARQNTGLPPLRAEYEIVISPFDDGERRPSADVPLSGPSVSAILRAVSRKFNTTWLRKTLIGLVLLALWQVLALSMNNALLLPTATDTLLAFVQGIASGELLTKAGNSLSMLLKGYVLGVFSALVLTSLAVSTRIGRDLLSLLTTMFNPLPSIALLPIALLWFGLGENSILFVLVHAVLWPLALSTFSGFQSVSPTLRMTGRNYGLRGIRLVLFVLVPAAMPAILSGLRVGWAFAWRTAIAAELVFGTSSGSGGLGWYIFENRNELYTDRVFAGLIAVVVIGLIIEHVVFDTLERLTVRRWGMHG